ncbi:hypothetical protein EVG20_g4011 [Dentipellis fragilis]|uniref:Uncharacterized protein n=1 Tax=Dentipellis fragilis TaxID=205917 RepID=A0A4Y9Z070_9AGAM|nr:hypothetical protein EVG20_g4011 [Dentipellis fragilis]
MIARGRPHAAVQDDLVHALQAARARQGVDMVLDPELAAAVAEEGRHDHIRKGRSPQRMRHTPRSSISRSADVLASPAMTALSGLEDEDALREFLPDFLDLGMDSDPRMSFAPAAVTGRNLMWILDEERALTSVPEGSTAPVHSPASSRMSYEAASSSGWNGDYDYERADPILAPTPIPGSHPRKAHSTPDFAKPGPFLRPALSQTSSHSSSSPSYNGVDVDVVIDAHLRQHVRSPEDRLPPRMETSASPHPDMQRYQRPSPLERLQTDISQIDPRDAHGHPPPQRLPPRAREPPQRDAPEIVYDRDGRAFLVRRSEPARDVPYEDDGGRRIVVDRLEPLEPIDPAYERPYDRPAYDDYSDRHSGDPYAREGAPYSREYIARREQSLQREWPQAPRAGAPVSRDQLVYAYHDDERHFPSPRDPVYPPPREPAYPSPRDPAYSSPRDRAFPPPVAHDLQRPPLRNRAYSATDREYVMYDDREYLEYRNRPLHGSAVYEHELASAVGRQVRQGDRDPAYSNGSHYAPSSGSGGPSPAMSPAPTTSPREQHASPVLRSNGGMSPLERGLSVQERGLPPQDREAYQRRPQQQRSPAVEDAIRRGDIADGPPGPPRYVQEPSPLRHTQDPNPHPHSSSAVDQAVSSPTSPQAAPRPQADLLKVKDESKLAKTSSIVESVSSKSDEAGKVTRAATPAPRPRAPPACVRRRRTSCMG